MNKRTRAWIVTFLLCSVLLSSNKTYAIVGTQASLGDTSFSVALIHSERYNYIKVWVYCENGGVKAKIVDENGNEVDDCAVQSLSSASGNDSHVFWVLCDNQNHGSFYLHLENDTKPTSMIWYHYVDEDTKY